MPNLWSLVTGPIFKVILILLIGVIMGWFASDMMVVARLQGKVYGLQEIVAELKAEVQAGKLATRSAYQAVTAAEEQCRGKIEHERKKPKDSIDVQTDVTPEYLDSFLGGVRKGGGKDSDKANAPGSRTNPGSAPATNR